MEDKAHTVGAPVAEPQMSETGHLERKLAAILYADVAGYSRLTGVDEEGTHLRLSSYLDDISEAITTGGGRVVHYAGDAVLADFSTVTDALSCATAIQVRLAERNAGLPDEQKVQFRIGVNLGEVIVDRDDIYGDGVNIAARLEGLAEPGGICISSRHSLIRYDARGNGLSDWDVDDMSFDGFVQDLEAVVDAVGLERFPLFGVSQGCAVSVAYAVRHPERVTKLILYGGFARGRRKRGSKNDDEESSAVLTLMRHGWGKENPAFRQMFTSLFIPGATREQMTWFNELQRITTSGENAVKLRRAVDEIDVTGILDQVKVPTLALHCRGDAVQPFEEGRRMAAMIPKARFVTLERANHLMLEDDPAWPRFKEEVRAFLAEA